PDNGKQNIPEWFNKINQLVQSSDLFIFLVSKNATRSEMTVALTQQAYEYKQLQGRPQILPVFVANDDGVPHPLNTLLDDHFYSLWTGPEDNQTVYHDVLAACTGTLPERPALSPKFTDELSEDGDFVSSEAPVTQPRPQVNPLFLDKDDLAIPGGAVKLRDQLYIERDADIHLKREVIQTGTTMTIRAPRQSGKSSLLVRGLQQARQHGLKVINIDLQSIERKYLTSLDNFLHALAEFIVLKLRLDQTEVDKSWGGALGPQMKLTNLFEDYILAESGAPIVLAIDEADRLLQTEFYQDFFSLLRSWHNERAYNDLWDSLNLILAISTEPYLLIPDISQSPFNVGLKLYLEDFSLEQVQLLNQRHNSPISIGEVTQLMRLLNGHPYLTRTVFYTLITQNMTYSSFVNQTLDETGPFGDHLRHHYWLLQKEGTLKDNLKQVINQNRCDDENAFFRLLRAGLVKGTNDSCSCRCELYEAYFKGKL
ncbi:MAG: AAA-like domain-containing protein, partial [Chloroflexota bacterium]